MARFTICHIAPSRRAALPHREDRIHFHIFALRHIIVNPVMYHSFTCHHLYIHTCATKIDHTWCFSSLHIFHSHAPVGSSTSVCGIAYSSGHVERVMGEREMGDGIPGVTKHRRRVLQLQSFNHQYNSTGEPHTLSINTRTHHIHSEWGLSTDL